MVMTNDRLDLEWESAAATVGTDSVSMTTQTRHPCHQAGAEPPAVPA